MIPAHDHELDGHLHDGCPMCEEIRVRMAGAVRDRKIDETAKRYAAIVERRETT